MSLALKMNITEATLTKQYYKIQSTYFSKGLSLKAVLIFPFNDLVVLLTCSLRKVVAGGKMGEVKASELNKLQGGRGENRNKGGRGKKTDRGMGAKG